MSADTFDAEELGALYDAARDAEDNGDIATAIEGFKACLALDPDDHCGVVMRLAKFGEAEPGRAPTAYVATLFDQHADVFDSTLVGALGYDVPALSRALVGRYRSGPLRLADIGCGTGLCGEAFADIANHITGVDLAPNMLSLADERGVYDDLYIADVVDFMAEWDETPFDVIVAADVLPYLGGLDDFTAAAARALAHDGLLVASSEKRADGWGVTQTQRFSHADAYVAAVLTRNGFSLIECNPITVRLEEGEPVAGSLVLAKRDIKSTLQR